LRIVGRGLLNLAKRAVKGFFDWSIRVNSFESLCRQIASAGRVPPGGSGRQAVILWPGLERGLPLIVDRHDYARLRPGEHVAPAIAQAAGANFKKIWPNPAVPPTLQSPRRNGQKFRDHVFGQETLRVRIDLGCGVHRLVSIFITIERPKQFF